MLVCDRCGFNHEVRHTAVSVGASPSGKDAGADGVQSLDLCKDCRETLGDTLKKFFQRQLEQARLKQFSVEEEAFMLRMRGIIGQHTLTQADNRLWDGLINKVRSL